MNEKALQPNTENKPKRKNRLAKLAVLVSTSGVIVLFVGLLVIYTQFSALYARLAGTTSSLSNQVATIQQTLQSTGQQIQQVNAELAKQSQSFNELRQAQGHPDQWRVAEAQYLVKLANDQLQLMQNIPVATKLLQAADETIKTIPDPSLDIVRKALATDITHLQGVPELNLENLYTRLLSLNEKLDQLPLMVQQSQKEAAAKQELAQAPWWKKGLQQTWHTLQKIVVVQHSEHQIPLLSPEQREFLFLNLHTKLEQAVWGLLHHQPVVYQNSLTQISDWVKRYFAQDTPQTQAVLASLTELQQVNVQPPAVAVTDSLQAFQGYFQLQKV